MILGIGTDLVAVGRVRTLIERYGDRFLRRWFSDSEIGFCSGKRKPHVHFAARLAAKEAAAKALGADPQSPPGWRDVSVEAGPDGAPRIVLSGAAKEKAERLGVTAMHLSISHCDDYATATVVAEAAGAREEGHGAPPRPLPGTPPPPRREA